ncbi:MAG TPA: sodium:proton antiporter NhaD [Cyclobacteriaceae bacterium]|nr:sodium:proton antiporter NhaD [Cyclobacteriaceae bacterium]
MELLIVAVFVIGYILIALEHPIKINKTATALLTGVICWTLFMVSGPQDTQLASTQYTKFTEEVRASSDGVTDQEIHTEYVIHSLAEHLAEIAEILFFLMGAMTIVELVDSHRGFKFITDRINTTSPKTLLWVICWVTFILSAILDNLTTTIVMVSLTRKLVSNRDMRLFFAGMIIVAANAGGAWSPIGDVTTTMLWIGGQISAAGIVPALIVPSIVCMLVPLLYLSFTLKGTLGERRVMATEAQNVPKTANLMLAVGVGALISVPVFKTVTHLPPYLGMMLGLGFLWVVSELMNSELDETEKRNYTAAHALSRIDMPSVLFFLGILLAVGSLQSMTLLQNFAQLLNDTLGDNRIIITLIGILSAIVDNVPLVAASMGMYSMETYPIDHMIWEYLAYCAGTGGSILVIGSAAGVAAMGMEKIDFIWYLKKISILAAMGYFAGAAVYLFITHP